MNLKAIIALMLPTVFHRDVHDEFTRAVAANIHANKKRRSASAQTAMIADARAETLDATIHRIEGRSGDRLVDNPHPSDAALRVANAAREFLDKRRS